MAARLGDVLYWAFGGLALLLIGFIVFVVVEDTRRGLHSDSDVWLAAAVPASPWCFGSSDVLATLWG
jgi:hypothetical protein